PIERDRFWVKVPDSSNDVRVPHPAFASYNYFPAAPEGLTEQQHREREHAKRRSIRGVLVHSREEECFEWHRKAQKLPPPFRNHSKLPACTGDGKQAKRLVLLEGGKIEHQDI